jgi:DNA-binding NarL/FixJ family response regulator
MSASVLVVENYKLMRMALRRWIEVVFPEIVVTEAACAEEALARLAGVPVHLVIMDMDLPGMSALEATRRIKAAWPDVRVVMSSAHDEGDYPSQACIAGAGVYIPRERLHAELLTLLTQLILRQPV